MARLARIALFASLAALLLPLSALAAERMPVGFQDDPTFRWNGDVPAELDKVQAANASIIRATADWRAIAPKRPRNARNSFDPAYNLNDLDDLVRGAQQRGIQVMITIWGTPAWANGGKTPNYAPKRVADLTNFARALADRYSGRHAGYPFVGRYSIWNEPNLGLFLMPQFGAKPNRKTGKYAILSPGIYARLYKAGYAGIKSGNRLAEVAIGETSNQGRDYPKPGAPISTAPGTFARLLAQTKGLRFDAYATHPYATRQNLPPTQKVRWPNVTLTQLPKFEKSIDQWFKRKNIPIWITEYGYETKPGEPSGVARADAGDLALEGDADAAQGRTRADVHLVHLPRLEDEPLAVRPLHAERRRQARVQDLLGPGAGDRRLHVHGQGRRAAARHPRRPAPLLRLRAGADGRGHLPGLRQGASWSARVCRRRRS